MKKFLSLVMALVMTMSLVTIGAGATEYKDFTDKSEVQYEEAVAVLNKIGIITGYEGGDFKPTGALTRGAAAKIIVSLMIGSEAAGSLQVAAAPYKDVPVTNTFAAVISYCKTAGYINGYSDGTFRPTGALTGFAFAKMLLGALGYKGDVEGFSGSGWTMKVASVGSVAGLYNDFITPFQGNAGVTREQACQLALNTLKATKVEYKGDNINVSTGDANVSITNQNHTDVVNSSKTDGNIWKDSANGYVAPKDGKMQFAEQHFTDLKQVGSGTEDKYGHPANQWSYKNVTIGKYAKAADFTFTAGTSGNTDSDKLKNLGLDGYKVADDTSIRVNGLSDSFNTVFAAFNAANVDEAKINKYSADLGRFLGLFGNGTKVEIYVGDIADVISDIVVTKTEIVEISTVTSKNITVKKAEEAPFTGYSAVKDDDDAFAVLSGMKSGDYALVTPLKDGSTVVDTAAAPTVVTGALTGVTNSSSNKLNGVIVGGTTYKLAANRDLDSLPDTGLNSDTVKNSKKDVTLHLDQYGYVMLMEDAGSTSEFFVYAANGSMMSGNRVLNTVIGYDFSGNEIELNIGNDTYPTTANTAHFGDILTYTSTGASSKADYAVSKVAYNSTNKTKGSVTPGTLPAVSSSTTSIAGFTVASDVKTIFVNWDNDTMTAAGQPTNTTVEVKNISVVSGVAKATALELTNAQLYLNKDGVVKAIVIMDESQSAVSDKVMFIENVKVYGSGTNGNTYTYNAWIDGTPDVEVQSTDSVTTGQFATYVEKADGTYTLRTVNGTTSATSSFTVKLKFNGTALTAINGNNENLIYNLGNATEVKVYNAAGTDVSATLNTDPGMLNLAGAVWSDLTERGFASGKSLADFPADEYPTGKDVIELRIIMNNNTNAESQYKISQVVVVGFTNAL
ncbi:S-layer homology domain-containing protein [Oscillibacter sp.]|uniref:S-layer homology domain-containing protein n=1 Tax=Oscillibacter sp. TaxID=1945593 RepID=UPI0028995DD8|nr:S-layer homology domain-containing protein [Oscillibacter sp.]